jgi:hypothetical protein
VKQQTMNQKLAAVQQLGVTQLRAKYLEVFGEPTRTGRQFENRRATGLMQSMIAQVIPSGRRH